MRKIMSFAMIFLLMATVVLAAGSQGAAEDKGNAQEIMPVAEEQSQHEEINAEIEANKQNKAETQVQERVKTGEYTAADGKKVQIQEQANNRVKFQSNGVAAQTSMQMNRKMVGSEAKFQVRLSNGKDAEIKIMPDTASERAIERLQLKVCTPENCQIELKEVGQGEQARAVYEVQAQKQVKVLGLFKKQMQVQAQISAENGEVIQSKKPWWAFLASDAE